MRKLILIFTLLLVTISANGEVPAGILKGFKEADAEKVSTYFEATLEMTLDSNKQMYSKAQAKQVLTSFFRVNKPSGVAERHSGGRGTSRFSQLTFSGNNKKYRATILYKGEGESARISQMTIEEDTGF